ncbi:hypothetical protein [Sphingomonas sp. Y38-1Y]|uniref:hypothetical protein n=1 Tax=Sphingomonas sp. Y38-1Y TaxID=3078265 RepID=UPI0028E2837B|nr:hypothetical protein [Sphingomonas sp. Y38-1Y]
MATRFQSAPAPAFGTPQLLVLLCAVLQIVTPTLPLLGLGEPIGSQSDAVRTLITPAGWAFSIWGALYTGSLLFAIWQALPAQRGNAVAASVRMPAAGAFLGNALWAAYTQVYGLGAVSVVIIAWTLGCLLVAYSALSDARLTTGERWFAYLPLSALAAWLTVATTVNIAASLRFYGVEGGDAAGVIGGAVILVAGGIALAALLRGRGNLPYAGVFLWALAAIYAAGGQESAAIASAVILAAILVVAGVVIGSRHASD